MNRKSMIILMSALAMLTLLSAFAMELLMPGTPRTHENYVYIEKGNKLIINPWDDGRFTSGLLLCDSTWFGAIEYFNNKNFDIKASALIKDTHPILAVITTWGPYGGEHPFDTIRFSPYLDGNGRGSAEYNPRTWFDSFTINSSEFEVSGMKVGESKNDVAKHLGLRRNQIHDTIVVVSPSYGSSSKRHEELFSKFQTISLNERSDDVWKRLHGEIHFIFNNDTIMRICTHKM